MSNRKPASQIRKRLEKDISKLAELLECVRMNNDELHATCDQLLDLQHEYKRLYGNYYLVERKV